MAKPASIRNYTNIAPTLLTLHPPGGGEPVQCYAMVPWEALVPLFGRRGQTVATGVKVDLKPLSATIQFPLRAFTESLGAEMVGRRTLDPPLASRAQFPPSFLQDQSPTWQVFQQNQFNYQMPPSRKRKRASRDDLVCHGMVSMMPYLRVGHDLETPPPASVLHERLDSLESRRLEEAIDTYSCSSSSHYAVHGEEEEDLPSPLPMCNPLSADDLYLVEQLRELERGREEEGEEADVEPATVTRPSSPAAAVATLLNAGEGEGHEEEEPPTQISPPAAHELNVPPVGEEGAGEEKEEKEEEEKKEDTSALAVPSQPELEAGSSAMAATEEQMPVPVPETESLRATGLEPQDK